MDNEPNDMDNGLRMRSKEHPESRSRWPAQSGLRESEDRDLETGEKNKQPEIQTLYVRGIGSRVTNNNKDVVRDVFDGFGTIRAIRMGAYTIL
jgi:RNA recognition motif-containing protein